MVVDDVERDRDATGVRGVDEPLEGRGAAVHLVHGVRRDAVVPPVVPAREGPQREQLDHVDPEVRQVRQPLGRRVQGALGGERAHVRLVEHRAGQLDTGPGPVGPGVRRRVEPGRCAVRPVGEGRPTRIRTGRSAVEGERVALPVREGGRAPPPAAAVRGQRGPSPAVTSSTAEAYGAHRSGVLIGGAPCAATRPAGRPADSKRGCRHRRGRSRSARRASRPREGLPSRPPNRPPRQAAAGPE